MIKKKSIRRQTIAILILVLFATIIGTTIVIKSGDSTGEAFRTDTISTKQCPTCLRDFEIIAYAQYEQDDSASFTLNGDRFNLLGAASVKSLSSGGKLILKGTLIQSSAEGIRGPSFHVEGLCPRDYTIDSFYSNNNGDHGEYDINGERFNLERGETHVLSDGTKIIHKSEISQLYVGGLNGVVFELIC